MSSRAVNPSLAGDIGSGIINSPQVQAAVAGIFSSILAGLLDKLFERLNAKPGSKPSIPEEDLDGPDDTDVIPTPNPPSPIIKRYPAELRVNFSGITRKKQPNVENSGRIRVDAQGFRKVMTRADGAQMGDVIDENITPYDQFGKPFMPGEGVNELLLRSDGFPGFVHNIHGKGYLVREAPKPSDPYGCTPGIRVPSTFQDDEVKPGYEGELWDEIELPLDENNKACFPEEAVRTLKVSTPKIRVKPWA